MKTPDPIYAAKYEERRLLQNLVLWVTIVAPNYIDF